MLSEHQYISLAHEEDKIIAYEKGNLLFIFNFNNTKSFENYEIGTLWRSEHFILFESDDEKYDGNLRLNEAHGKWIRVERKETHKRPYTIKMYLPTRTCIVLCAYENVDNLDIPEMPPVNNPEDHLNNHYV